MLSLFKNRRSASVPFMAAEFHPAIAAPVSVEAWLVLNLELAGVVRHLPLLVADAKHFAAALEQGEAGTFFTATTPEQQRQEIVPAVLYLEGYAGHATLEIPGMDVPAQALDAAALARVIRTALCERLN